MQERTFELKLLQPSNFRLVCNTSKKFYEGLSVFPKNVLKWHR